MATKYTLNVNGVPTDFARSTKATVVAEAESRRAADKVAVSVTTDAGNVVFELAAPKQRVITVHTKPFTKVIDVDETIQELVLAGYVAAHRRPRNGATLLRNMEVEKDERYAIVFDNGAETEFASTTREGGAIMAAHAKTA